jgi:hypothetical protein
VKELPSANNAGNYLVWFCHRMKDTLFSTFLRVFASIAEVLLPTAKSYADLFVNISSNLPDFWLMHNYIIGL